MRGFLALILAVSIAGPLFGAGNFFFVRVGPSGLDKNLFLLELIRAYYGSEDAPPAPVDDPLAREIQRALSDSKVELDGPFSIDRHLFLVRPGSFAFGASDGEVENPGSIESHACRVHGALSLLDGATDIFHLKITYAFVREYLSDNPFPGAVITESNSCETSATLYSGELVMTGGISETRKDASKGG